MKKPACFPGGFTLTELLMTAILLGMVFLGAISLYTTGLKFLGARQAVDVSVSPSVSVERIVRNVSIANAVSQSNGNSQISLRVDQSCADAPMATPSNFADDTWRHFRLINSQILTHCDNSSATTLSASGNPVGATSVLDNVNTISSTFSVINPSSSGASTVVSLHIITTTPPLTVDTEVALGASPKR